MSNTPFTQGRFLSIRIGLSAYGFNLRLFTKLCTSWDISSYLENFDLNNVLCSMSELCQRAGCCQEAYELLSYTEFRIKTRFCRDLSIGMKIECLRARADASKRLGRQDEAFTLSQEAATLRSQVMDPLHLTMGLLFQTLCSQEIS